MPIYEFRCEDSGQYFQLSLPSVEDYDPAAVRSPYTGSTNVTRIIRQVNLKRGGRLDALVQGDEALLHDLEDADPAQLGRTLREMAQETGEDLGADFNAIVDRLEAGMSPDDIEASLPPPSPSPGEA